MIGGWGEQRWHFEWVKDRDLPMSAMPGTSGGQSPTPSVDHLNLSLPQPLVNNVSAGGGGCPSGMSGQAVSKRKGFKGEGHTWLSCNDP